MLPRPYPSANPSGLTYQVRLSDPFGMQVAVELCREWWNRNGDGGSGRCVWRECFIDRSEGGVRAGAVMDKKRLQTGIGLTQGEPFTLNTFHDWPARLPNLGDLTITLAPRGAEDYPTPAQRAAEGTMSGERFAAAWDGVVADAAHLKAVGATAASASDTWRLSYAHVLGDAVWLTPQQVGIACAYLTLGSIGPCQEEEIARLPSAPLSYTAVHMPGNLRISYL